MNAEGGISMQTVKNWTDRTIAFLTCTLMGIMVLISIWQVFTRYVLNSPSTFSEEFLRYSLIWVSMLGSAYVFGKKKHFAIEFLIQKLSEKKALIVGVLIEITILAFALIVMVIGGSKIVMTTMSQLSASLGMPMGYVYLSLPVSGVLIIGYSLINLIEMKSKGKIEFHSDDLESFKEF